MREKARVKGTAFAALLMAAAILLAACQPTPEKPPVAAKNTGLVKTVLDASGDKEELKRQKQVIQEQIEALGGHLKTVIDVSKQVTINVDADIVSHGLDPIPLVRVEPENFTKEKFETFMDLLTHGQPVYCVYTETDKHGNELSFPLTKEEIAAILLNVKAYLLKGGLPESVRSDWDVMIKFMEQEYESTISRADEKLYDGTLNEMEGYNSFTVLKCYMGKDMAANLGLQQSLDGGVTHMSFNNHDFRSGYNTFETYEGVDAERLDITYEEAKAIAEGFVRTLDGEDSSMMLYKSAIGYEINTLPNYTRDTSPQAYAFYFARSYNGIPVKRVMYLRGGSETVDYSERVLAEYISVEIDDGGINSAEWHDYKKYIETVSEDSPILDFDTIRQIFEKHCAQEFGWTPGYEDESIPPGTGVTFNVKKIEMNLMDIPEKDNPGIYITVPVWDFIADEIYSEEFLNVEGYLYEGQKDVSIVTINAIDGTIIDREQGY